MDNPEKIRVITKLPNFEQSNIGKVKTHKYINRQNQSTTGKLCEHWAHKTQFNDKQSKNTTQPKLDKRQHWAHKTWDETKQTKSTTTKSHGPPPNTGGNTGACEG